MSEQQNKAEPKLYSYLDTTINAVLDYLGKKPAEEVLGVINSLLKPVKVEEVSQAKPVVAELVE